MTALCRISNLLEVSAGLNILDVARDERTRTWVLTVAPSQGPCGKCGRVHPWPASTMRLSGADVRNPKRLAEVARRLGRPESARPLTAEDGRKMTRDLWAHLTEKREWGDRQ